jgi:hypothetical protein
MSTDETNDPTDSPDDPLAALEATVRKQRERLAAKRAEIEAGLAPSVHLPQEPIRSQPLRPELVPPVSRPETVTPEPIAATSAKPPPTLTRPADKRLAEGRPAPAKSAAAAPAAAKARATDDTADDEWPTPAGPRQVTPTPEKARWPVAAEGADGDQPVGLWRTRLLLGIVALILGFAVGAAGAAYFDRQDDADSAPATSAEGPGLQVQTGPFETRD